jgi:predicted Zn-dependent protease
MSPSIRHRVLPPLLRAIAAGVLMLSSPALLTPTPLRAQALPSIGGGDGEELSPLMERRLGEQVMTNIRRDPDYLDDLVLLDQVVVAVPEAQAVAAQAEVDGAVVAEAELMCTLRDVSSIVGP